MTLVNLNSSRPTKSEAEKYVGKRDQFLLYYCEVLPSRTKKIKEFMKKNFEFVFLLTKGVAFATFAS